MVLRRAKSFETKFQVQIKMSVIKTYIYGWGEAPRCFDGEAIAPGSNKLALVLGAEDCAVVQTTLEPSDVRNIDDKDRYF